MMDTENALFIVNKKAKEIRDLLQFCKDNGRLKEFRILIGILCGPGAEERLHETITAMRKKRKYLYALKFTFLKMYGKPVDASFSSDSKGFIESYLIYDYMGHRYHTPETIKEIRRAGVELPDHYDVRSLVPALMDPISEQDVREAMDALREAIGNVSLQDPPFNAVPMNSPDIASVIFRGGVETREIVIRDLGKYRRYLASRNTTRRV